MMHHIIKEHAGHIWHCYELGVTTWWPPHCFPGWLFRPSPWVSACNAANGCPEGSYLAMAGIIM